MLFASCVFLLACDDRKWSGSKESQEYNFSVECEVGT